MKRHSWLFGALAAPLAVAAVMATGGADAQSQPMLSQADLRPQPTRVLDAAAMQRLRRTSGMTLQWISWDYRGPVRATMRGRTLWLEGNQRTQGGGGEVALAGWVREVGARHFVLVGTVTIADTPDVGRNCVRTGEMRFQVTQNRRYWRMQRMTECDGLTDYVDVYF